MFEYQTAQRLNPIVETRMRADAGGCLLRFAGAARLNPASRFFGLGAASPMGGEVRLLLAMSQDTINSYRRTMNRPDRCHREEYEEVNVWFRARNQPGLFASERVCAILGIDWKHLRRWLDSLSPEVSAGPHMRVSGRHLDPHRRRVLLGQPGRATPQRHSEPKSGEPRAFTSVTRPPDSRDILKTGRDPAPCTVFEPASAWGCVCASS